MRHPFYPSYQEAQRGFSLLESLLVCSIISILIVSASISVQAYTTDLLLRHDAGRLKLFFEKQYARALNRRERIMISVDTAKAQAITKSSHTIGNLVFSPNTQVLLQRNEPISIFLHPTLAASPKSIRLRRGGHECRVVISLRGRFRVSC
jgi:prepilin-type N-terminal cleavage/methylation domain-containing protein